MGEGMMLGRVLLRFGSDEDDLVGELSAAARTQDGSLWLGSDELLTLERLVPGGPQAFGEHRAYPVGEFVELYNDEEEIDIEGMDYSAGYLWLVGSHSTKRKKPKGKKLAKDLDRLATVTTDANRYLLARIPFDGEEPRGRCADPADAGRELRAAALQKSGGVNVLVDALAEDRHLGPFLSFPLPSKENGFDVEGLAVHGERLFLGFRGPVLRGWAVLVEIKVEETAPGVLGLAPLDGAGALYYKHFLDLDGLGVRELCLRGEDLYLLAGPTLDTDGAVEVFRLPGALGLAGDSVTPQRVGRLDRLFALPAVPGADRAEGLALCSYMGEDDALMVIYDAPHASRRPRPGEVYADVFRI